MDSLIRQLKSGDDELAEGAVTQIAALGTASLSTLKKLLRSTAPDHRWWALRTIAEIDDPGVPQLLIAALDDADPSVRQCAALGLRLKPDAEAIPGLVTALAGNDPMLAALAADALVAAGEPAVPALLDTLSDGPPRARLQAVRALALIGDTRAVPALFAALEDDSNLIQFWAERGLETMGVGMVFFQP